MVKPGLSSRNKRPLLEDTEYRESQSNDEKSTLLLIYMVDQSFTIILCNRDYRNVPILHLSDNMMQNICASIKIEAAIQMCKNAFYCLLVSIDMASSFLNFEPLPSTSQMFRDGR